MNMKSALGLLMFCLYFTGLFSQSNDSAATAQPALNPANLTGLFPLASPRDVANRHLYYLRSESYEPDLAKDAFPVGEDREVLASQLKQILNASGYFVDTALLSNNPNYIDSVSGLNRQYIDQDKFDWLYIQKVGDTWQYAQETVASIPQKYTELVPPVSSFLLRITPRIGQNRILGLQIWQYVGLLLVILMCYLLFRLLRWGFSLLIQRGVPRIFPKSTLDLKLIPPVTRPLSLYIITWLLRKVFIPGLILPIWLSGPLTLILNIATPILGVVVVLRVIDVIADLFKRLASRTDTTMDDQLIPLVVRIAKIVVVTFGVIFILSNLDVDVTALLAGVSIGGLALALAAQDTVKNFIGSISIFIDRPFVIGDFVATDDFSGVITEVGVRTTRVRALDGAQVTVPNGKLADMIITNHGVRTYRRYATNLALTYDSAPETIEVFVDKVREIAKSHPLADPNSVTVNFHEMADSSLNVFFAVVYQTAEYGNWLQARQEVFLEIMKVADSLGLSFAFPSTSVYVEQLPGQIQEE